MSGKPICGHCGAPAPGASICPACERDLTAALVAVIALGPDLDTALARQAVIGDRSHSARSTPGCSPRCGPNCGHVTVLPYDPRVAEVASHIHGLLGDWYHALAEAG